MAKKTLAAILILLLVLPAVIAAGGVFLAPELPFADHDEAREKALESALNSGSLIKETAQAEPLSEENRYIVKFSDKASLEEIEKALADNPYRLLAESECRLFAVSPKNDGFLETYSPIIDYAEPDLVRGTQATVNDPITFPAYDTMGVYTAWDSVRGNGSVIVAVLDTGVDRTHEDLSGVSVLPGYDAVERSAGVYEDSAGHGTAVIGLIAATADNGLGIAGIAHGVSILPVKVSASSTIIYSSDLISGIRFAADAGAKVINMSVGGYSSSYAEQDAINYAVSKGCIPVSASGNGGALSYADQKSYPASYDGVISVASCDPSGNRSSFSQYNDSVDVAAPGENVTVLDTEDGMSVYKTDSGTSYSCAFVSGIAALAALSAGDNVRFGSEEFLSLIIDTCGSKRTDSLGYGIINAPKILQSAKLPIITGVFNGGVYSESVRIGFNRGEAVLDGDIIEDGETVITNGYHSLTVTDGDVSRSIRFRLNYDPISYSFKEFKSHAAFEFDRGTALLDGFPYKSGEKITASGRHVFTLTYGDEYLEKEFTLSYSLPEVYGVENNGFYNHPVEIVIVGEGTAQLDGKPIFGEAAVIESGEHVLTVKSGNGAVTEQYNFTVNFPLAEVFETDYADASAAVDEENGFICLYGDSLVGVRIYDITAPEEYLHFLPVGRVYGHAFAGDELLLFGDEGVTVIGRQNALQGQVAVRQVFSDDRVDVYAYGNNAVYGFGDGNVFTADLQTETLISVARIGFEVETALYADGSFCLLAPSFNRTVRVFDCATFAVSEFTSAVTLTDKPVCFGDGYLAVGNKLFDAADGGLVLEFSSGSAVMISDGRLFSDNRIIEISTGTELASFPFGVSDIVSGESAVYVFGLDPVLAVVGVGAEGVNAYGAAERTEKTVSSPETVNEYRKNAFYGKYSDVLQVSAGESRVFFLLSDKNMLFGFESDSLAELAPLALPFAPSAVCTFDGFVAVTFASAPVVYIAPEDSHGDGVFLELPDRCDSLTVADGRIYAAAGGRIVTCRTDGSELDITSIPADSVVSDGIRVAVLNGNRLGLYDLQLVLQKEITASRGALFIGNGIAAGRNIYDLDTLELKAVTDSDIIAFRGDTVVTEKGVFSLRSNDYAGNLGIYAETASVSADNVIFSMGDGLISVCAFGDGTEVTADPGLQGVEEGGIYIDCALITYAHGIGYLDGGLFPSGSEVTDSGEHLLHIALPCGRSVSVRFTVEEYVSAIEFLVGDRTMSVGETVTLRIKYLPDGASSVPVTFSCAAEGLSFGEMGEVTALAVGKYTVNAEAATQQGTVSASCVITVRDDLIAFDPESGITVDRDNGFVLGVKPGTKANELVSMLYSGRKAAVLNKDGSAVKGFAGTGNRLVLYDAQGNISDELSIVVLGDTDGDGLISAYDLYVHGRILRGYAYDPVFEKSADINGNGLIADNDYRDLKNIVLRKTDAEIGSPEQNLFGRCSVQTVSYIESESVIDVAVCLSGSKYARGVMGVISFGEGLEFIEGASVGWESDFHDTDGRVSFFAYSGDGEISGKAFTVVMNLRFRVTASAGEKIRISSEGITVSLADGSRTFRFEDYSADVKEPRYGEFEILVANAYSFSFDPDKTEYSVTIPYNSALADVSVIRSEGQTVTVEDAVVPVSGEGLMIITCTDEDGSRTIYNIAVRRDEEPKFDTNCRLEILEVEGFRLEPSFNPEVLEYNLSVPYGTEKINIYCVAQNSSAEVVVGDTTLHGEITPITVTVGAPDGESLVYTINVTVLPPVPDNTSSNGADGNNGISGIAAAIIVLVAVAIAAAVFFAINAYNARTKK